MRKMSKWRLRRSEFGVRYPSLAVLFLLLLPALVSGQEVDRLPGPSGDQLVSRLTSGDEEQRLNALAEIIVLLPTATDSFRASAVPALSNSLQQDLSPVVRAMAARGLEVSGDDRAIPPLIAALGKERQIAVRKAILYALGRYPRPQVTTALIPFLNDKKQELRASSAYALAEIADPAVAPILIEVLRKRKGDKDAFTRSQAARGLGRIGSRDALEPLLYALTEDKSRSVRREAAAALGRIATRQDTRVIEALRAAAISDDPYLTNAADTAITSINAR
jgi:HEAT repeat protein